MTRLENSSGAIGTPSSAQQHSDEHLLQHVSSKRPLPAFVAKAWFCLLFLLASSPVLGPILLISTYGVDVPYWDEWNIVDVAVQARKGVIPTSLFSQHNEHRIVVPRLIYCVLDNLTHWNQIATMITSVVIVYLTAVGIYVLSRLTIPRGPGREVKILGIWFVSNLLIFSIAQWENWLWAVGMINVLNMFFIVWGMVVIRSRLGLWWKLPLALLLATAATYSTGNGALAWPLMGLLWAWSPSWAALRQKTLLMVIWCAGCGINAAMYFHHYVKPGHAIQAYTAKTSEIIWYLLAFMGAPFGSGTLISPVTQSTVVGVVLFVLLVVAVVSLFWLWRGPEDFEFSSNMVVWLAVAGFTFGSGVLAGPTRAGLGTAQALSSRYITFGIYMSIAILYLAMVIISHRRIRQMKAWSHLVTVLITAMIILQIFVTPSALPMASVTYRSRMQGKAGLVLIRSLPDSDPNLELLFPAPSQLRSIAENVNALGFIHPAIIGTNRAREIQISPNWKDKWLAKGHLDHVMLADANNFVAAGWAVFPNRRTTVDCVFLTYDNPAGDPIIFAVADLGSDRGDVAKMMNQPNFENCGWRVYCPTSRLPAGSLQIRAWSLVFKTGKAELLNGGETLQR